MGLTIVSSVVGPFWLLHRAGVDHTQFRPAPAFGGDMITVPKWYKPLLSLEDEEEDEPIQNDKAIPKREKKDWWIMRFAGPH